MRRGLKKISCAILCTCLLMINATDFMSYAENAEQYATDTDAAEVTTDTDAEHTYATATDTDALYAAPPEELEGERISINSQSDWDSLFAHNTDDGSGWISSGLSATYIYAENPVTIILNSDITLSGDTTLTIPEINSIKKEFVLQSDGHSIDMAGYSFRLQAANTVTISGTRIKSGTMSMIGISDASISASSFTDARLSVTGHNKFICADSGFETSAVELVPANVDETIDISGCTFSQCTDSCIRLASGAPAPVNISNCYMNESGLLFTVAGDIPSKVRFSHITAENCTGAVLGQSDIPGRYIIESISDCKLSTSQPGSTAIYHSIGPVGEISDCVITGFDTGITLNYCNSGYGIDTMTIRDTEITDCLSGLYIQYSGNYDDALISNLTITAREGTSGMTTVGYKGKGNFTSANLPTVGYRLEELPCIKACNISGFDTGIDLYACEAVISDCAVSDCDLGILAQGNDLVVLDTALNARDSVTSGSVGVKTNRGCNLIDCDINGFFVGSDNQNGGAMTIIGCKYQNLDTNLKAYSGAVYDTSFTGGETSVQLLGATAHFYGCAVEGDATKTLGFVVRRNASALHIYSSDRPYKISTFGNNYNYLKDYSDRAMNHGKSEISNCKAGVDAQSNMYIADTHIHDCETGIQSSASLYSYGNNLVEDCRDGMIVDSLYKYGTDTTFTDIHTDTIRNCFNNGIDSRYITAAPTEQKNRLEIYDCGNYGIAVGQNLTTATVDIHDCKTGVYMTETSGKTILDSESKVYDNLEWNIYDNSSVTDAEFVIQGSEGTLTEGTMGNVYAKHSASINTRDLYSDDSVYYLGTDDLMYLFGVNNLHGTVVFDTADSGYTIGRRVAKLTTDITSQMFAKKEGIVISSEEDAGTTYAVFAAGCDVTYDITANGGETFSGGSLTRISYLDGSEVDLTYTASRTGYEFVGWNTDQNATEGLDALTAGTTDITLYAIYKKDCYINYHTYDAALDYRTAVTFYNNETRKTCILDKYPAGGELMFIGYVLDHDADVSSADDVLDEGGNVTVSPEGLDVYCVYEKRGRLDYLKKDGTISSTERITVYQIMSDNKKFVYTVKAGESVEGFTFTGWKDNAGNSYAAGNTLRTENNFIILTPVYEENEKPTTETPTTEAPTTEAPTTETPSTETPTTETPSTAVPTTGTQTNGTPDTPQDKDAPKTGDTAEPICALGLSLLSLLGILTLSRKKRI